MLYASRVEWCVPSGQKIKSQKLYRIIKFTANGSFELWWLTKTIDQKIACGHMMPPPLHFSDSRYKCFPYRRCHGKQKGAMNERKNTSGVGRLLHNSNEEKKSCKILSILIW